MNLNQRIAYVVERDGLDGRRDINSVDHPDLWWAMYQRDLDYFLLHPFPVMPGTWEGYQRLLADDYWPPGPDAPDWAQVEVEDEYEEGVDIDVDPFLSESMQRMAIDHLELPESEVTVATATA